MGKKNKNYATNLLFCFSRKIYTNFLKFYTIKIIYISFNIINFLKK